MILDKLELLKFYLTSSQRLDGRPLHEAIVAIAHRGGLAAAAVFRAELGYGHDRHVHDTLGEYTFTDPPLTVEIVGSAPQVEALIEEVRPLAATVLIIRRSSTPIPVPNALAPTKQETPEMNPSTRAQRLNIYIESNATWHGVNLAVSLVEHCRAQNYAGVTVTRGVMGFGKSAHIHKAHPFHFSQELPEKLEVIDTPERIASLLDSIKEMIKEAIILLEDVEIIRVERPTPGAGSACFKS